MPVNRRGFIQGLVIAPAIVPYGDLSPARAAPSPALRRDPYEKEDWASLEEAWAIGYIRHVDGKLMYSYCNEYIMKKPLPASHTLYPISKFKSEDIRHVKAVVTVHQNQPTLIVSEPGVFLIKSNGDFIE